MKNKAIFFIGILIVIIISVASYYIFFDNTDNTNTTTNKNDAYILSIPGSTDLDCISNVDCLNACKNDGCLISSCVKNQDQETGKCACFDLCGI